MSRTSIIADPTFRNKLSQQLESSPKWNEAKRRALKESAGTKLAESVRSGLAPKLEEITVQETTPAAKTPHSNVLRRKISQFLSKTQAKIAHLFKLNSKPNFQPSKLTISDLVNDPIDHAANDKIDAAMYTKQHYENLDLICKEKFSAAETSKVLPNSHDRYACAFALAKGAADNALKAGNSSTFQRGNDITAQLASYALRGQSEKIANAAMTKVLSEVKPKSPIVLGVSNASFGIGLTGDGHEGNDFSEANFNIFDKFRNRNLSKKDEVKLENIRKQMTNNSIKIIDGAMEFLFGNPADATSVNAAAGKIPKEACNLLATQWKAIDACADGNEKDKDVKRELKLIAARNSLVLRGINPELAKTRTKTTDPQEQENLKQLSKVVQSLVNGAGVGDKDTFPDLQTGGAHLKGKWAAGFEEFARAVVARADNDIVNSAALRGQKVLDARSA